jgi:hypothetical protein
LTLLVSPFDEKCRIFTCLILGAQSISELLKSGAEVGQVVATALVEELVEFGEFQPVVNGGAMYARLVGDGDDGVPGGEEGDGIQLDSG